MSTVTILKKPVVVRFSGNDVIVPVDIQAKIDAYWKQLIDQGKTYTRGASFTVTKYEENEYQIDVLVEKTDYAHYVYSKNLGGLGQFEFRSIHTAAAVITSDNNVVFGQMSPQTARAGLIQLSGGGLEVSDLRGDTFDLEHSTQKELREELGIDVLDNTRVVNFKPAYFKSAPERGVLTVIYRVDLHESSETFRERYNTFEKELLSNAQKPEFSSIFTLPLEKNSVEAFLKENGSRCVDLEPLFNLLLLNL